MNTLLIGNLVSMLGAGLMVVIGILKTRRQILLTQCLQFALMGAGNLVLGGYTGAVSNFLSIVRNGIVCALGDLSGPLKLIFIAVQVLLSAMTNAHGLVGWLPVAATVLYTWMLDAKSEVTLKLVMIAAQLMWLSYDIFFQNYTAAAFDILTVASTVLGILRLKKAAAQ